MPYRYLPDIALADIAYEASSSTMAGLFEAAASALTDVMVDPSSLRVKEKKRFALKSESIDRLLYDFLTELIIAKDVDSLLFKKYDVSVDEKKLRLVCSASGEKIDRERHRLRNDAKAVTMHMFGIRREGTRLKATVVLDI